MRTLNTVVLRTLLGELPRGAHALPRIVLALGLVLPLCVSAAPESEAVMLHESYRPGSAFMGMRFLGMVELNQSEVDGVPLTELSALAWDEDHDLLYAVSDNGYLYHLEPGLNSGYLVSVKAVAGFRLRDENGKPLGGKFADAEGMLLVAGQDGNAELLISFERRPRVLRFSTRGEQLGEVSLAKQWKERRTYTSENKALEGIAPHPQWGLLVAPEWPIRGAPDTKHYPIIEAAGGKQWLYPRFPAPKAGMVAMEILEDGGLLTLERAFVSIWQPMYIVLRRSEPLPQPKSDPWAGKPLESSIVAEFSSAQGWIIDNFEGLAHHRGKRFFMVSDNNRKALQRTLLVYFELLD